MPFKSEEQRRWMWANEPEMARRWADEAKDGFGVRTTHRPSRSMRRRVPNKHARNEKKWLKNAFGVKMLPKQEIAKFDKYKRDWHGRFSRVESRGTKQPEDEQLKPPLRSPYSLTEQEQARLDAQRNLWALENAGRNKNREEHPSYHDELRRFEMDKPGKYQAARDRLGYTDVKGGHAPLHHGYDTWSYQGRQDGLQNNMYIKSFDASTGKPNKSSTQKEWEYRHSDEAIERAYTQIQAHYGATDNQMEQLKTLAEHLGADNDVQQIKQLAYLISDSHGSRGKAWVAAKPDQLDLNDPNGFLGYKSFGQVMDLQILGNKDYFPREGRFGIDAMLPSTLHSLKEEQERLERLKQKNPVVKNDPFHKGRYTDVHKAAQHFVWL